MKPYNARQILAMIALGENINIDFKESLFTKHKHLPRVTQNHELVKDLVAFANTDGGYLLVGVNDKGKVTGFESSDAIEQKIINLCRDICTPPLSPTIYSVKVSDKEILVIKIDKGNNYLHLVRGKIYVRVHNEVRLASSAEITDIILKRNHEQIRELLQEKENLASLIGRVSTLSEVVFLAKNFITEIECHDFCQGQISLTDFGAYNVYKIIKECENLLTNLDNIEMSNLSKYIVNANDYIAILNKVNELLEQELDHYYSQFESTETEQAQN